MERITIKEYHLEKAYFLNRGKMLQKASRVHFIKDSKVDSEVRGWNRTQMSRAEVDLKAQVLFKSNPKIHELKQKPNPVPNPEPKSFQTQPHKARTEAELKSPGKVRNETFEFSSELMFDSEVVHFESENV